MRKRLSYDLNRTTCIECNKIFNIEFRKKWNKIQTGSELILYNLV